MCILTFSCESDCILVLDRVVSIDEPKECMLLINLFFAFNECSATSFAEIASFFGAFCFPSTLSFPLVSGSETAACSAALLVSYNAPSIGLKSAADIKTCAEIAEIIIMAPW